MSDDTRDWMEDAPDPADGAEAMTPEPEADETETRDEPTPATGGPSGGGMDRRDILKAFATVPVFGALGYAALRRKGLDDDERRRLMAELGIEDIGPELSEIERKTYADTIRIGIVGYGGEGESLVRLRLQRPHQHQHGQQKASD